MAYLLFLAGILGLALELYHPGAILPGVVGAISLILAFFAFQGLPVHAAGILLILLGLVLFILEVKVTSYGVLSIGGVTSLVLGSLFLFGRDPAYPRVAGGCAPGHPGVRRGHLGGRSGSPRAPSVARGSAGWTGWSARSVRR